VSTPADVPAQIAATRTWRSTWTRWRASLSAPLCPRQSACMGAAVLCLVLADWFTANIVRAQALEAELTTLLREHPEIRARQRSVEAAQEGVHVAYAGFLPTFDVFGETGPQYIDSPVLRSEGGGSWTSVADRAGAQLTQNLFDGFATPSKVKSARLNVEVAEFALTATKQNILFEGISSYVEVLRQNQLVGLARDSERTIMRQLNLEDERVQRGAGIAVDVLQAKSRLQVAKERRIGFEGGLADAMARYIQVFGHPPEVAAMTEPTPPVALLPGSMKVALDTTQTENPAVDASLATVAVADERKRLARSDYYPKLDVVARANRENDSDLVRGTRTDMSVVLAATWNLFNGFATEAGVNQAAAEYKAARQNHQIVTRKVEEATRLAWHEWTTSQQRVELLQNAVAIALEVFEARHKLREAGRETVINVLDAENEVYNARIGLVIAEGNVRLAQYRLLQGMGRLGPAELGLPTP
jgi:outer membrane protein, adhesin transport system